MIFFYEKIVDKNIYIYIIMASKFTFENISNLFWQQEFSCLHNYIHDEQANLSHQNMEYLQKCAMPLEVWAETVVIKNIQFGWQTVLLQFHMHASIVLNLGRT